jgi:hypothetical protein
MTTENTEHTEGETQEGFAATSVYSVPSVVGYSAWQTIISEFA